jgi:predicted nucleic acid-binding protein
VIVVDTTVWVDFFRAKGSRCDLHLVELIDAGAPLVLTDLIYCEVLQGIRDEVSYVRVRRDLQSYPILMMRELDSFEAAAKIYRDCRAQGLTIRKTIDCLIAAACLDAGAEIFHNDRDFDAISRVSNLRIHCF